MFGIGGSSSRSVSNSNAYGYSVEGSESSSDSLGQSTSSGRSFTDVAFKDLFADLYSKAGGAASRVAAAAPGLTDQANMLFSGGLGFLDQIGGGAGADYLEGRVGGSSPVLDDQIDLLGEDLGRFFSEDLNPAITGKGVAGGTLGGSRQGVAQGRAAEAVTREFRRGATDLRARDIAARDSAATTLVGNRTEGAAVGLNGLSGLLGIAQGGFGAELAPWQALASIMGGPVTLGGSEQSADAFDIARSIASSFGASEDRATSSSSSKTKSLSV